MGIENKKKPLEQMHAMWCGKHSKHQYAHTKLWFTNT